MPMTNIAMMMCLTFRLFHSSQTQKPMPTPPVSISAATITSQAVPTDKRTSVNIYGNTAGNNIRVMILHSLRLSILVTFR